MIWIIYTTMSCCGLVWSCVYVCLCLTLILSPVLLLPPLSLSAGCSPPDAGPNIRESQSQKQAHDWLMNYQTTPESDTQPRATTSYSDERSFLDSDLLGRSSVCFRAWTSSIHLLHHPDKQFRFFGATILHTKVKSDWSLPASSGGLTSDQQHQLMNQTLIELRTACEQGGQDIITSKLALILADMAAKTPNGSSQLLTSLLPSTANPAAIPSLFTASSTILLEVLSALAEEVHKLHFGNYSRTEEVTSQLRRERENVEKIINKFLNEGLEVLRQQTTSPDPRILKSITLCMNVLVHWGRYGISLEGLYTSGLIRSIGLIYASLFAHATNTIELIEVMTEFYENVLSQSSFPRSPIRDAAVDEILTYFLPLLTTYQQLVRECTNGMMQRMQEDVLEVYENATTSIARISAAIGEHEMDYLASWPNEGEDADQLAQIQRPEPNPQHRQYFEFHLAITLHPYNLKLVEQSLNVWSNLQDQHVPTRKFEFLKKDIFLALMQALLTHAVYPPSFIGWNHKFTPSYQSVTDLYFARCFVEDPDAFRRFRAMMVETFLSIYGVLNWDYLIILAKGMGIDPNQTQASQSQSISWQTIEVALMALLPVAKELSESIETYFSDPQVAPQSKHQLRALFDGILQKIWSFTPTDLNTTTSPLLLATGCAFIKSFRFLLKYSAEDEARAQFQLEQNITFLLRCIPATQTPCTSSSSTSAAYSQPETSSPQDSPNISGFAFKSLCTDAYTRHRLIHSPQILGTIVKLLFNTEGFSSQIHQEMKELWLKGLGNLVITIAYSPEAARNLFAPSNQPVEGMTMTMAGSYLQEITSPALASLAQLFNHWNTLQQQPHYQPTNAEIEGMKSAIKDNLALLSAVLTQVSYAPDAPSLQVKQDVIEKVMSLSPDQPRPPSFALQVYSTCWPFLQQTITLFTPMKDADILNLVISIYSSSISLLYPYEVLASLNQMIQSAMAVYSVIPLPSILALIEKLVSSYVYGTMIDLRDTWCTLIGQIYKATMVTTKENFKSHTDVFDAFFDLCVAFYSNCTYCFITSPSNALTHILQFCVVILDSLPTQRSTMQKCLYFLEKFLDDVASIDILPEKAGLHQIIYQIYSEQGSGLLRQLLFNISDALPPLIDKKIAWIFYLSYQRFPALTQPWMEKALFSDYVSSAIPHITDQDKHLFLSLIWPLHQNPHQFRSLWEQWNKVAQKKDEIASLLSFQITPSGRLKGSPQDDAAFATL